MIQTTVVREKRDSFPAGTAFSIFRVHGNLVEVLEVLGIIAIECPLGLEVARLTMLFSSDGGDLKTLGQSPGSG